MHILHPHSHGSGGGRPIVSILSGNNGVDQLNPNLTINGTTVAPMFRYKGGDADGTNWDEWGYGATLPLQAGTVPSYNQGSPLLGTNDDSVKFNAGGYYRYTDSTFADITTEDIAFEIIFKMSSGTEALVSKRTSGAGYVVFLSAGSVLLRIQDSSSNLVTTTVTGLPTNVWYHLIGFWNRSDTTHGVSIFVNGVLASTTADLTSVGSITVAQPLVIGATSNGSSDADTNVAYAAMWIYADWMQAGAAGPTEHQAIAKERFLRLTGFWSDKGTVTYSRATEAALSKREGSATKYYIVGEHWPRMDKVVDSASSEIVIYRDETEDENELLYSTDYSDAVWVKTRATIDADNALAPDKSMTADGLIGTAVSNTHSVGQAMASGAGEHVMSFYAKSGDKTWAYVNIPTVANANAYFNLATCAPGTVGAGATAYAEDLGDGWCRLIIIYTGGAPSHSHDIYAADADGDHTYTGDGTTVNIWLWCACHSDKGLGYPTSPIKTEASLVTRVKDDCLLTLDAAFSGRLRIECKMLLPNFDAPANKHLLYLSDGGSANESVAMLIDATGDVLGATITEGGVSRYDDGCTTDIADGVIHTCTLGYNTGIASQKVDGVVEDTGTPAAIPDDLDQLEIGQNNSAAEQLNGGISEIKIYRR